MDSNEPPKERTVARLIREAREVAEFQRTRPWVRSFSKAQRLLNLQREFERQQQEAAQ